MSIDFEIPAEAKAIRERIRKWVHDECLPAEQRLLKGEDYKAVLAELRQKARGQGLWCPFIPKEHGGMGLGPLANALVQMELGESHLGALSMNTQGPDDATMLTLLIIHFNENEKSLGYWNYFIAGVLVFLSAMMVSTVRYPSFKSLGLRSTSTFVRAIGAAIFIGAVVILREKILYYILPAVFTLYLIYGFVRPSLSRAWRREIEEEDEDEEKEDSDDS